MARQCGLQSEPARYLNNSDGPNADRYRYRVGRGGDNRAAVRRWAQLRARIRVARSLRHKPTLSNNDGWWSPATNRLQSTKNRQRVGYKSHIDDASLICASLEIMFISSVV